MRILLTVLAVGVVTALSGCGTNANLTGRDRLRVLDVPSCCPSQPRVFGGVANDLTWGSEAFVAAFHPQTKGLAYRFGYLLGAAGVIGIDLPLSLVGDTLSVPVVLRKRRNARTADENQPPPIEPKPNRTPPAALGRPRAARAPNPTELAPVQIASPVEKP